MCGGLLIANHLDPSLWSTNQKYWAVIRSKIYYTFFWKCATMFGLLPATASCTWCRKTNFLRQIGTFWLFVINFTIWNHRLRISTAALYRALEILDEVHQWNPVNHWNSAGTLKLCTAFRALEVTLKSLITQSNPNTIYWLLPVSDWLDSWIRPRKLLLVIPNYLESRFQFDGWGWKKVSN
jgi:hypothetical protein